MSRISKDEAAFVDVPCGNHRECYGLNWPGKTECIKHLRRQPLSTLKPCPEESVDFDTTENLFIEGDNLEALKLLQQTHYGRIKTIYIDPPYNTGNDLIYADDFSEPLNNYLELTGQKDARGRNVSANVETAGRFHAGWLNMMLPRLLLARNLLREDGVIFISIDDHEITNLRYLCNEVFGEENFAAQIVWQKAYSPRMDVRGFSVSHDYILCYVKNDINAVEREVFKQNPKQFSFFDEKKKRHYRRRSLRKEGSHSLRTDAPHSFFPLLAPDHTEVYPMKPDGTEGCWRWSAATYDKNLKKGNVEWLRTETGWQVYARQYLNDNAAKPPETLWLHAEVNHNHGAAEELKKLLGAKVFNSPKPKELIMKAVRIGGGSDKDAIILDFFAGSCTTAHAVMQLNITDGGNRKFIMVQMPEPCNEKSEAFKAGYTTIADIGKERVRRAARNFQLKILSEIGNEKTGIPDLGFRVLKLDHTSVCGGDSTTTDVERRANRPYIKLDKIAYQGKSRTPHAIVSVLECVGTDTKVKSIKLKYGNDVGRMTNRDDYEGYVVTDIYSGKGNEHISFANGVTLHIGCNADGH